MLLVCLCVVFATGCTQNYRARYLGGKQSIQLPKNQKLVNVTWKESSLWILTRSMTSNDTAESYSFTEKSNIGMIEGTITLVETK